MCGFVCVSDVKWVHVSKIVRMCVQILVDPILLHTTCCSHAQSTRIFHSCFYWIIFYLVASQRVFASLWMCCSPDTDDTVHWISRLIRGFLIYSMWFMRLDPFMKIYEKSPICIYEKKRFWVFQAPLSSPISFFHFSFQRRGLSGIYNVNHYHPSKNTFSQRLDLNIECCYFKLQFVAVLNRCSLWWDKLVFISMLFMQLF